MIGTKFNKKDYSLEDYAKCSEWCNENNARIEDKGDYFECVEIPPLPIEDVKAQKLAELKQARDNAEALPITTDKGTFDFDDISRTRLDIALKVLTLSDTTLEWTLADNTTAEVTADDINTIFVNSAIRSNDLHNTYRDLKAQVLEATTSDEVGGINWNK